MWIFTDGRKSQNLLRNSIKWLKRLPVCQNICQIQHYLPHWEIIEIQGRYLTIGFDELSLEFWPAFLLPQLENQDASFGIDSEQLQKPKFLLSRVSNLDTWLRPSLA